MPAKALAKSDTVCNTAAGKYEQLNVHVDDAASAYVLALKHAQPGDIFNIVNGKATGQQLADAIASKLNLKTKSISKEEAVQLYGPVLGFFFSLNSLVRSDKARKQLSWQPAHAEGAFLDSVRGKAL